MSVVVVVVVVRADSDGLVVIVMFVVVVVAAAGGGGAVAGENERHGEHVFGWRTDRFDLENGSVIGCKDFCSCLEQM